jgi:alpha-N-acetylglucosamine transferase
MSFCESKKKGFLTLKEPQNYAYITLLFPDPKTKKDLYLDGNITVALGLRRQKTKAALICMCTPDVSKESINLLKIVYDKVVIVDYILPHPDLILNVRESYKYVFTKFHILNKKLFNYKKVCFVDSDIIPLKNYDSLFHLKTPAGIIEPPRHTQGDIEQKFLKRCNLKHGSLVPKHFTDLWKPEAGDSNAGLWVLTPNTKEFNAIIKQIQSDPKLWIGPNKKHKGFYTENGIVNKYGWPEQQYLTVRYSGKWTSIGFEYASWCFKIKSSLGIHFVLRNTPWLKYQPTDKCVQLFYKLVQWGLNNYQQLKLLQNLN